MQAVRASWNAGSFLLYAGGLAVLLATGALLGELGSESGAAAFVGWSAVVFAVLEALAFAARAAGRRLTGGLLAFSAVVVAAVFVGAVLAWFGWLAPATTPFGGFHPSHFAIELTLVAGAVVARRTFRFPLLVLLSTGATWFFVTDLVSNGGNWSTTVTLLFGFGALLVALASDPIYGFWVHVVAGLTIGGALLTFWHTTATDWILIGLVSLAYLLLASGTSRSSYAVLAAVGLFLTTTHFVFKWFLSLNVGFFDDTTTTHDHAWAAALSYAVYGFVLMLIGLWFARRRGEAEPF